MLSFFRKHQKGFFIFTTVIIVASFTFFGTSGLAGSGEKVKEEPLGKSIGGSVITKQRLDRMIHFISFSHLDLTDERITNPNWLNTGVVEVEFLNKPLGGLLAKEVFPYIKEDISCILNEVRSFHPYVHPSASFLSSEAVWGQFAPESMKLASSLKGAIGEPTLGEFESLISLYLQHKAFPSSFLKRVLINTQVQDGRIPADKGLSYADVSLLGLHKAEDWLGRGYLSAAAQLIIHASDYAQSKGMNMTLAQAREQLLLNLQEGAKKGAKEIDANELYGVFIQQIRGMGMDEGECLALYRDIALFERLMASVSSSLVVDPVMLQEFYGFAKELAILEEYSLPESLQLKDFTALLKLQVYIDAITPARVSRSALSLPSEMLSLYDIEKKYSSLVQREYVLEYAGFSVKKASSLIGLKETWNWQVSDQGWQRLQEQFSVFSGREEDTKEARFVFLERLDGKTRGEVDQFAREVILASDKGRMQEVLSRMKREKETCSISAKGDGLPFKGIKNKKALAELLEDAALQEETPSSDRALAARDALMFYSEDGDAFYSIQVVQRALDKKVLTFAEASDSGLLKQMLDKKLEAIYPKVRKKNTGSYLQADGTFKPLSEVKDQVGLALYPDLLKSIVAEYTDFYGEEPTAEQKESTSFYVKNRMIAPLRDLLEQTKNKDSLSVEESLPAMQKQWQLKKKVVSVPRSDKEFFSNESLFLMPEGSFSPVTIRSAGKGGFFHLLSRQPANAPTREEADMLLAPLKLEAEELLVKGLLKEIREKGGFYLDRAE
jgi:GcvH upstream region-like protein